MIETVFIIILVLIVSCLYKWSIQVENQRYYRKHYRDLEKWCAGFENWCDVQLEIIDEADPNRIYAYERHKKLELTGRVTARKGCIYFKTPLEMMREALFQSCQQQQSQVGQYVNWAARQSPMYPFGSYQRLGRNNNTKMMESILGGLGGALGGIFR